MVSVRLYRLGRKNHFDSVLYKKDMIFGLNNAEILALVISDYQSQISNKITGVSPQWS